MSKELTKEEKLESLIKDFAEQKQLYKEVKALQDKKRERDILSDYDKHKKALEEENTRLKTAKTALEAELKRVDDQALPQPSTGITVEQKMKILKEIEKDPL